MNYDTTTKEGMANSVAWTERLFSTFKEGAVWMIPRSGVVLRVYPSKNEVVITEGLLPEPELVRVIKTMGWQINRGNSHEVS